MHDDREASLIGSRDEREWIEAMRGPHLGRDWTRSAPADGQRDGTREAASLSQAFLVVRTPLNFVVALVPPIERMLERRPECRLSRVANGCRGRVCSVPTCVLSARVARFSLSCA